MRWVVIHLTPCPLSGAERGEVKVVSSYILVLSEIGWGSGDDRNLTPCHISW
jgi:hypothetical protein